MADSSDLNQAFYKYKPRCLVHQSRLRTPISPVKVPGFQFLWFPVLVPLFLSQLPTNVHCGRHYVLNQALGPLPSCFSHLENEAMVNGRSASLSLYVQIKWKTSLLEPSWLTWELIQAMVSAVPAENQGWQMRDKTAFTLSQLQKCIFQIRPHR